MRSSALVDTHVHLDWLADPAGETAAARASGIDLFVVPGVTSCRWPALLRLAREIPGVLAAPGLHPKAAAEWNQTAARELERLLTADSMIAVGEIGLDASPGYPPSDVQEACLRGQLRLAVDAGKPVLLHCRKATGRLLSILRDEKIERVGGILHAFSGSEETAREAIRLRLALGFGGPLTWPGARRAPHVLRKLPAEWIVLETDAPDLPPHPHRGAENRPAWLSLVAAKVAEIRCWSLEETAQLTTGNARRILKV